MHYNLTLPIFYSDVCLIFIVTGIICAVVRWFHMCRPYDQEADYYYPARRQVTFFCAAVILQLPYFLCPMSEAAWQYVRIFSIIFYPCCFSMLFQRYFHRKPLAGLFNVTVFTIPISLLTVMAVTILAGSGNWLEQHYHWFLWVMVGFSVLLTARLLGVIHRITQLIDNYHIQNYATEDDFPLRFAEKVIWMPLVWIGIAWLPLVIGSRLLMAIIHIVFSVWMVIFLCLILHPQRSKSVNNNKNTTQNDDQRLSMAQTDTPAETTDDTENDTEATTETEQQEVILDDAETVSVTESATTEKQQPQDQMPTETEPLAETESDDPLSENVQPETITIEDIVADNPEEKPVAEAETPQVTTATTAPKVAKLRARYSKEAKEAVLQVILQNYRDKHLLKTQILSGVDKGLRSGASRFIAEVGYYRLVNMFRLEYARLYANANPASTQVEVAYESGFISDSAYCKAKRNIQDINTDFVKGVHL